MRHATMPSLLTAAQPISRSPTNDPHRFLRMGSGQSCRCRIAGAASVSTGVRRCAFRCCCDHHQCGDRLCAIGIARVSIHSAACYRLITMTPTHEDAQMVAPRTPVTEGLQHPIRVLESTKCRWGSGFIHLSQTPCKKSFPTGSHRVSLAANTTGLSGTPPAR